jgi:hypothetical protein
MVKKKPEPRKSILAFRAAASTRRLVEQLAARLTIKRGRLYRLTDVLREAIERMAKEEGVK